MKVIGTTERVAKMQHSCSWCGEFIIVSERYFRLRGIDDDNSPFVNKFHLECKTAAEKWAEDNDGPFELWHMERPPVGIGHGIG
jgi:hypothetical protein